MCATFTVDIYFIQFLRMVDCITIKTLNSNRIICRKNESQINTVKKNESSS